MAGLKDLRQVNEIGTRDLDATRGPPANYCQNQHADVVALITAAGGQREMDRYSAYGVPFGLPTGDCDSDGDAQTDDANQIRAWYFGTPAVYDVRGDLDLDGDLDSTDRSSLLNSFNNVTLGRGALSDEEVNNRFGLAGSVSSLYELEGSRRRVLSAALGVWLCRDVAGYADSMNLFEYTRSSPIANRDWTGLHTEPSNSPKVLLTSTSKIAEYGETVEDTVARVLRASGVAPRDSADGSIANAVKHCTVSCALCVKYNADYTRVLAYFNDGRGQKARTPVPQSVATTIWITGTTRPVFGAAKQTEPSTIACGVAWRGP
ncbi:MAG: hypothetical protein IPK67_18335 [Planctomycetes bacterium]|nr:hypothetical protein [Planctomycetota bacterium]